MYNYFLLPFPSPPPYGSIAYGEQSLHPFHRSVNDLFCDKIARV